MGYTPHNGQLKLHFPSKEEARFFVMVCGRRFGKSTAAAYGGNVLRIPT